MSEGAGDCPVMPLGRLLVSLLLVAVFLYPAGPARAETVGVIMTHGDASSEKTHQAMLARLQKKGHAEKVKFLAQRPYPDPIAWSNAARKLIAADVDVLVTYGTPATLSAINERSGVPIVYVGVYEPVASTIDAEEVTGVCSRYQVSSLVRYLRDSTSLKSLGVVYSDLEEDSVNQVEEIKSLSGRYGFSVTEINVRAPSDADAVVSAAEVDALFITSSSMAGSVFSSVVRAAGDRKIPTASLMVREDPGATMMLSTKAGSQGEAAADMLMRILEGTPPGEVAPACSKDIELVFNLRAARGMGIRISMDLVTEATRIIY